MVVLNLLVGSLVGAWVGATWAIKMRSQTLHRVLAALLVLIAVALVVTHLGAMETLEIDGPTQVAAGVVAGFLIGVVAAVMGVAGGELLIPTIVLLFAVDIKIAGSLSLAVSLPTMLVAFTRYSKDSSFAVLGRNRRLPHGDGYRIRRRDDLRWPPPGRRRIRGLDPPPGWTASPFRGEGLVALSPFGRPETHGLADVPESM